MRIGECMIIAAAVALSCGCYKTVTVPTEQPGGASESVEPETVEFEFGWRDGTRLGARVERTIQVNEEPERRLSARYTLEAEAVEGGLSAIEAIEQQPDLIVRTRPGGAESAGDETGFLDYVAAANLGVRADLRVGPTGRLLSIEGTESVSERQFATMKKAAQRALSPMEERLVAASLEPKHLKSHSKADWSFWVESWAGQTMEVGRSTTEDVPLSWETGADDATMTVEVAAVESCGRDRCARIEVVIESDGAAVRKALEARAAQLAEGTGGAADGVRVDETFLRETHTLWTVPETLVPRRVQQERVVRARLTSAADPEVSRHYRQTVRTQTTFSRTP